MKKLMAMLVALTLMSGCTALTGLATTALTSGKPAVSLDAQVGDNNASLGAHQEVDAEQVDTVIGRDIVTTTNQAETIKQYTVPTSWYVIGIVAFLLMVAIAIIGWLAPVPKWARNK